MQKPHILVADDDEKFLGGLEHEKTQVEIAVVQDYRSAQLAIADSTVRYSAICLNVSLCTPFALPLVRHVKAHRPGTPLYLLSDTSPEPLKKAELNSLHIQDLIQKPITPQKLVEAMIPGSYFNLADALELGRKDSAKAGDARVAADESMHPIEAKSFLCGRKSFFDLFVRLGPGKFVMILKSGDDFDAKRLITYLQRGVEEFYIKKEAQLFYLQYCDKMTAAILEAKNVPNDLKISQVMNLGAETFAFLKGSGVSEATLSAAQGFVKQANTLVRKGALANLTDVQFFLNNIAMADHGTSVAMVTSMMVKAMGFSDDKVTGLIATGVLLHDIGLVSLSEPLRKKIYENPEDLSEEELEAYEKHPAIGAEILKKVPHVNPLLPQIVLQHHERRNRKGFPYKLGTGAILPAAEMVGLAETFLDCARRPEDGSPIDQIKRYHADEFSLKVIDSFFKSFAS
jgi:response regulator RpfG family c-di-GMP phosphodiesterase